MVNLIPWRGKKIKELAQPTTDDFPTSPFFRLEPWTPRVDIKEGRKHITVKAEIPGMEKEDLDITLQENRLWLQGEKKIEKEEEDVNYYRLERAYGSFRRIIDLPAPVDPGKVEAKYRRGVLTIKLRKSKEAEQRKIKIKSG